MVTLRVRRRPPVDPVRRSNQAQVTINLFMDHNRLQPWLKTHVLKSIM